MIMATVQKEKLLRVSTAAALLACSRNHVYELLKQEQLELVKIGEKKGFRITLSSLERFVASRAGS